jgi:hypothetical protein
MAGGGQLRGHLGVAVDVIGPAVEQENGWTVCRAGVGVPDIEHAGVDLLDSQ